MGNAAGKAMGDPTLEATGDGPLGDNGNGLLAGDNEPGDNESTSEKEKGGDESDVLRG
jgi:hypothetical protein